MQRFLQKKILMMKNSYEETLIKDSILSEALGI